MTSPLPALRTNPLPAQVFTVWATYWVGLGGHIPPLCYYRTTPDGAALFVVPLGPERLRQFLIAHTKDTELHYEAQGSALLDEWRWWGCWSLFSAQRRRPSGPWRADE